MISICRRCEMLTPLVTTFERPKAEWHCLGCGRWFALFDTGAANPTPQLVAFHQMLTDQFAAGARGPIDLAALPHPADPVAAAGNVKCHGCGADSGRTAEQGKPAAWYQRTDADGDQFACSRECIKSIAAQTGKTGMVLPW